jgi:hypothetical protein
MPTKKAPTRKRAPPKSANVRPQPLIAVRDVPSSSRWYSQLLMAERTSKSMRSDHAHAHVVIQGGRILSVGTRAPAVPPKTIVEGGGRFLVPTVERGNAWT